MLEKECYNDGCVGAKEKTRLSSLISTCLFPMVPVSNHQSRHRYVLVYEHSQNQNPFLLCTFMIGDAMGMAGWIEPRGESDFYGRFDTDQDETYCEEGKVVGTER